MQILPVQDPKKILLIGVDCVVVDSVVVVVGVFVVLVGLAAVVLAPTFAPMPTPGNPIVE